VQQGARFAPAKSLEAKRSVQLGRDLPDLWLQVQCPRSRAQNFGLIGDTDGLHLANESPDECDLLDVKPGVEPLEDCFDIRTPNVKRYRSRLATKSVRNNWRLMP
jgi:hypothetical protein